jgi:DNA invertase Pin-like site-specific DNA recombinase
VKSLDKSLRKFISYLRVSTDRQGECGYGIDAQRKAVADYLDGGSGQLLAEFVEVESGKKNDRPQLAAALAACLKHKARLVIAKLDRLARNVAFTANLMDGKVDFVCCDMPEATRLTIPVLAAVAEREREMIAQRTKGGLRAAKARGVVLGGPKLPEINAAAQKAAAGFADDLREVFAGLADHSMQAAADALNERGIRTASGGKWHAMTVHRVRQRLSSYRGWPRGPRVGGLSKPSLVRSDADHAYNIQ